MAKHSSMHSLLGTVILVWIHKYAWLYDLNTHAESWTVKRGITFVLKRSDSSHNVIAVKKKESLNLGNDFY